MSFISPLFASLPCLGRRHHQVPSTEDMGYRESRQEDWSTDPPAVNEGPVEQSATPNHHSRALCQLIPPRRRARRRNCHSVSPPGPVSRQLDLLDHATQVADSPRIANRTHHRLGVQRTYRGLTQHVPLHRHHEQGAMLPSIRPRERRNAFRCRRNWEWARLCDDGLEGSRYGCSP